MHIGPNKQDEPERETGGKDSVARLCKAIRTRETAMGVRDTLPKYPQAYRAAICEVKERGVGGSMGDQDLENG